MTADVHAGNRDPKRPIRDTKPQEHTGADSSLVRSAGQLFAAYIEYMKLMLSNLFILNAGSATTLIAYFGTTKPQPGTILVVSEASLTTAVIAFASGAVLAIVAALCLAIGENINAHMVEQTAITGYPRRYSERFAWAAGIAIAASGTAFFAACMFAVSKW